MRPLLDWPTVRERLKSLFAAARFKSQRLKNWARRSKRRPANFEALEARRVFAAAIWHNVLQPFNVNDDGGGAVSPIDALMIINELNTPQYRDPRTGALPAQVPDGVAPPLLDTTCDGFATALDALLVINAINVGVPNRGWTLGQSNSGSSTAGRVVSSSCSPKLIEGDSLFTELAQTITLPDNNSSIRVSYEAPAFDTSSSQTMRDAFEIAIMDVSSGLPLALPFSSDSEASFNWSEGKSPLAGPGTQTLTQPAGSVSTATFNLAGVAAGTKVQVVTRLVNNDRDVNSSVVLRRVETLASTTPAPSGMTNTSASINARSIVDRDALVDVTASVDWNFGRTTLSDDHSVLTTDVQVQNANTSAISANLLLVVENTSDSNVILSQPDGFLEFGQPYFNLGSNSNSDWLAGGESTATRQLVFRNLDKQQFELKFRVLAQRNSAPTGFTSQPLLEVEAGRQYSSRVQANDPDQQALSYSKIAGPDDLKIDSSTGQIEWPTQASDIGNHYVVVRATDPFGLSVDLPFTISVRSAVENRPPIITSTPDTTATAARPFEVLTLATGPSPAATAIGDFDSRSGNGLISLITADAGSDALSLLTGSDKEQFSSAKPVSLGEPKPQQYGTPFVTTATVELGFLPGTYSNKERNVLSLVTADINQDGYPDFGVSINTDNSNPGPGDVGSVGVRLGNGDGTFRDGWQVQLPSVTLGTTGQSSRADSIRIADVTGDGLLDFVAVQSWGNRVLVYAGQGDGQFTNTPIASEPTSVYGYTSQLGDMNGDDKLDLVTYENQDSRFRSGTTVRLGDGAGNFSAGVFYPNESDGVRDGYLADVNGDGALDSIRLNPEQSRVEVRLNDGTGTLGDVKFSRTYFIQPNNYNNNQNNPLSAYLGDYDGDGKNDILVSTYTSNFFLLKGNNDGTFGNNTEDGNRLIAVNAGLNYSNDLQFFPSAGRNDGRAPDLNGDGKPDFVFGNQQTAELTTAINDGTGHFTTNVYLSGFSDDGGNGSVRGANATPFVNVADYNRDGVSDVLLGRMQSAERIGGVGIAFGDKAAGSLRLPKAHFVQGAVTLQAGNGASVVGDFDEDGVDDIATLSANRIYVARGNDDGSFGALLESFLAGPPFLSGPLVMDDFDKDGHLDLATGDGLPLFGLGNGTFQAMSRLSMPAGYFGPQQTSSLQGIASGDVNGDSYPDLIYRLPNNHSNFATETILAVFLYRPTEHRFVAMTDTEHLLSLPRRTGFYNDGPVGFEDLDGDGHRELFAHSISIVQGDQVLVPSRFTIWQPTFNPNATDASDLFSRTEIANPSFSPNSGGDFDTVNAFAVTDLNHDGHPDLVLGSRNGMVTTSFGNGDFTFNQPVSYSTNQVMGFRMFDVNGDGLLDIVPLWGSSFYNYNDLNNTGVLLGRADGSFGDYQGLSMSNYDLSDVIGGDFNGDGFDDLNYSYHLGVRLRVLSKGPGLSKVVAGDLNGDGLSDVVALNTGIDRVKVLLGNSDNAFSRQPDLLTDVNPVDLLLRDINRDGKLDILTANAAGKSISMFINNGDGSFARSEIELDQPPSRFVVNDLNNDGRADIVVVSAAAQTLTVLKGLASGFETPVTLPLGFATDDLAVADLTQDGKLDVLFSDHDGLRLVMLPGQGDGGFGAPVIQPLASQPGKLAISDMNADGRLDVIATYPEEDKVGILFGRGAGRFTSPQFIAVGMNPIAVSIADVNNDQLPDAVVTNQGDDTVSVILNRFDPTSVYHYQLTAIDPDSDPVTFDLMDAPGGAIYDDVTQTISWAPMPDQIGSNKWVVQASDGRGGQTQQGFTVLVAAPVAQHQPQFTSQPAVSVAADALYSNQPRVQLTSSQTSGSEVQTGSDSTARFSLIEGPAGATIDPITGRVEWDPRANGISLGVRGSSGYPNRFESRADVIAPVDAAFNTKNFTAEGWFRFDALEGIMSLFKKEHSAVPFSSSVYSSWNLQSFFGTLRFEMNDFKGAVDLRLDTIRLTTNTWTHIAVTYDDTNRQATVYVNGEAVGSATAAASPEFTSGALRTLGLIGTISHMRMWNTSRNAAEIRQDMQSDVPSTTPGLILDYRFKEGPDALTIQDASPLAHHGRLNVNGPYSMFNFPPRVPAMGFASSQDFTIGLDDGHGGVTTQRFTVQVVPPPARVVTGQVFVDSNDNGLQDGTELGLVGQTVFIDRNQNQLVDSDEPSAITDALGNYSLAVIGGETIVALDATPNFVQTSPSQPNRRLNLLTETINAIQFGVKSTADTGPRFYSTPPTSVSVPGQLRYQAFAQTTDASPLTYSLANAPAGLSIDAVSGWLQWSPRLKDAGTAEVVVKAIDGKGRLAVQRFELSVEVNTNPVITSSFPTTANVAVPYWVELTAQDAEQSQLTYAIVNAPIGVTLDALTGQLRWTPTAVQLGLQTIEIAVSDAHGGSSQRTYQVEVLPTTTNRLPSFSSVTLMSAQVGLPMVTRATAGDPDGDRLTYRLLSGPTGLTVASDGQIVWTPTELGTFSFRIEVSDGRGGVAETNLPVVVTTTLAHAPLRITSPPRALGIVNQLYAYDIVTTGAVHYELVQAPIGLSIDAARGWLRWLPMTDQTGPARVEVRAIDAVGSIANQTFTINVLGSALSPAITSTPTTSTAVGSTYVYLVTVNNPTANPLSFALLDHPIGMSINPLTGVIDWTPTASQVGRQNVIVRVQDGVGNYITQAFSILVASNSANRPPVATSTPPLDAVVGTVYEYRLAAMDPDAVGNSSLSYSLLTGPAGMSIDTTGRVTWTPAGNQIGSVAVTLRAADAEGAAAIQSYIIDVRAANRAPNFISSAPTSVPQGGLFQYDAIATDADREPLFFELLSSPAGATLDSLGRLRWQTALDTPTGPQAFSVRVRDGRGGSATQDFNVNVVADTQAPKVSILIGYNGVLFPWTKEPAIVKVQATDNVAVAQLSLVVDGKAVALRADGTADVFFSGAGNGRLIATALDPAGNRGTTTSKINMCSGEEACIPDNSSTLPQVAITSVTEGEVVSGFVDIVGTASASDFDSFDVSVRRADQTTFTKIASSKTAVVGGLLTRWDTTLLENDSYVIKLEARDIFGGVAAIERLVGVSGNLKLGNFRLSFEDLTIPVAGLPITLIRTYDTLRSDQSGEFGYGWRMEFRDTNLRTSLTKSGLEEQGIYRAFQPGTKVYLTLPGGQREGFTFTPDIRVLPGLGSSLAIATPRFTPDPGVKNILKVGSGNLLVNERGELYAAGGIPWNPASPDFEGYTLVTPEGTQYKIDGATGLLKSAIDRNQNTLIFSESGVTSLSSGTSLTFERDMQHRITRAIDPAGNAMQYQYDARGDLVKVIDRMGAVTQMTYRTDRRHYLDKVIDPLGRTGVKAEYGPDGRLTSTQDANGNTVRNSYDPNSSLVTIVDPLGNPTIYEYDNQGNIVSTTNALGAVTRMTYDENNSLLSETDALGRTLRYTRDDRGNELSRIDADGNVTQTTYDQYGNISSTTNAMGKTSRTRFDSRGNPVDTTSASGNVTEYSLTASGQGAGVKLPSGLQMSVSYNSSARPTTLTDAAGLTSSFEYNALGLATRIGSTVTANNGTANASTEIVVTRSYDAEGRLISVTDVAGAITRFEYDAMGNLTSKIDGLGNRTRYEVNAAGKITREIRADGSVYLTSYDAAGRVASRTDAAGHVTRFVYDAVGQLLTTIYPDDTPLTDADNPRIRTEYNLAGDVVAEVDELGNRTEYLFDPNGRTTVIRNPLGAEIHLTYNPSGAVVSLANPLQQTTTYLYDIDGSRVGIQSPDGTTTRRELAGGFPVADIDQNGVITRYRYTPSGQVAQVTDALGGITLYEYDARDRLVKQTDANGQVTRYEYNVRGQEVIRQLPGGQQWRTDYDLLGRIAKTTDPNGQTIIYQYDAVDRVIRKQRSDGVVFAYQYNANGLLAAVTDPRGETRYQYDSRNRLISRTEPDGQAIAYTYDAAGRMRSMTTLGGTTSYSYDAAGQMTSVTDPAGGITKYFYNAAGSLVRTELPNGIVETREYDINGRLVRQVSTAPAGGGVLTDLRYTLDATGRVLRQAGVGEVVDYRYDAAYRLTSEQSSTGRSLQWMYDAVGNRLRQIDTTGETIYQYDTNDRLVRTTRGNVITEFTYDNAGNQLRSSTGASSKRMAWDAENRLLSVEVTDTSGVRTENYRYDAFGNRVSVTNSNGESKFLLDLTGDLSYVVAEYRSNGQLVAVTIRGTELVGEIRDGQRVIFLRDRLDSVRAVTNATGAVVATFTYDAFGNVVGSTGDAATAYRYAGEPRSKISGLDHLRARSYDSTIGRFVSADSFAGHLTLPISRNRYIYASSDAVNYTDPTGNNSLAEMQSTAGIVTTLITTSLGAGYGFVKAKLTGRDVTIEVVKYAGIGFVVGVALSFGMKYFTTQIAEAAELDARLAFEKSLEYSTRAAATDIEYAGKLAALNAIKNLEMLELVIEALEALPWTAIGTLGAADLFYNWVMSAAGDAYNDQVNKVKVRVEVHNQQAQ